MSGADRVRQYKARQKAGICVLAVEVDWHVHAEYLIDCGLLQWHEAEDGDAIEKATARLLRTLREIEASEHYIRSA